LGLQPLQQLFLAEIFERSRTKRKGFGLDLIDLEGLICKSQNMITIVFTI
jgi:hypothetical protein